MNKQKLMEVCTRLEAIQRDQNNFERALPVSIMVDILKLILEDEQPIGCTHDYYLQGTSGFTCRKCGQIKLS